MVRYAAVFLSMLFSISAFAADRLTPQSVRAMLEERQARDVVNRLESDGRLDRIYGQIAKGSQAWIALAPVIAQGTDAATSEGLGIVLAHALPRNPRAVLAVVNSKEYSPITIKRVCSALFIEPSRKELNIYLADTRKVLEKLRNGDKTGFVKACLSALTDVTSRSRW